jgi:RNA polymerase-binding transcription factor DksA
MNAPLGESIRQELLSRRNKIASILENLQFQEVELRVRIVGHEEKLELNRLCMLDSLDAWYHRELIEVDNALMRIDTGEFGLCLGCGSQIDAHWIEVFPEGEFCRNCDQMKKWMALD